MSRLSVRRPARRMGAGVLIALGRVRKGAPRIIQQLERLLRARRGVLVGVHQLGQALEGGLDLRCGGCPLDAQQFVVIRRG